jgi:hypothetical protein
MSAESDETNNNEKARECCSKSDLVMSSMIMEMRRRTIAKERLC